MKTDLRVLALLLAALVSILTLPANAFAAWPTSPTDPDVVVSAAPVDQLIPTAVPDGVGGSIVLWNDIRGDAFSADHYVQRLSPTGVSMWTPDGVQIPNSYPNTEDFGMTEFGAIVPDGAGGAWIGYRSEAPFAPGPFMVIHVYPDGFVPIQGTGLVDGRSYPFLRGVPDGTGGAYFLGLVDGVSTSDTLFLQRIAPDGEKPWGSRGRAVHVGPQTGNHGDLVADGHGGAIVCWAQPSGIGAQHYDASGAALWTPGGVQAVTVTGASSKLRMALTGPDEVMVAWIDPRTSTSDYDLFVQRLDAQGTPRFGASGNAICVATGTPGFPSSEVASSIVSDGAGGAILVWDDHRLGTGAVTDIYAQHINSAGTRLWPANGLAVCAADNVQNSSSLIADGSGGAYFTWADYRSGSPGVYGQRLDAAGSVLWATDGTLLHASGLDQRPSIAPDAGGAVIYYDEIVSSLDVHATRVDRWGKLGLPAPVITSIADVPNDQGGFVTLNWDRSYVDNPPTSRLLGYLLWRALPEAAALERLAAGAQLVRDPADAAPTPDDIPLICTTVMAGETVYWEYLGTTEPTGAVSYSTVAATTSDSTASSSGSTQFFVSARSRSIPTQHWDSAPASGYSVDNTPPAAPSAFTAAYSAGTAYLHWTPSPEPDVTGYNVYRSTAPAMIAPGKDRLATQVDPTFALLVTVPAPDTGYVDPAGALYQYRLAVVDAHGNESFATTITPGGPVDVGDPLPAHVFAFAPPSPNPVAGPTVSLRYTLPAGGRVRIALYDLAGRLVARVRDGVEPAGEHSCAAPLEDRSGARLASGIYIARVEIEGGALERRLVVLRRR